MAAKKKVLLDNCVPKPFKRELTPYAVRHITEIGWQNFQDGFVLGHADPVFDVLITTDQNITSQQNLTKYNIALIVMFV